MILKNEQWYVFEDGHLRLATSQEVEAHMQKRNPSNEYWDNDWS